MQDMETSNIVPVESDQGQSTPMCSHAVAGEVHFRCSQHEEAFARLTDRQKEYVVSWMRHGKTHEVSRDLGLTGSNHGVSKKLRQIARSMGLESIRELRDADTHARMSDSENATSDELFGLIERQDYKCALSGIEITPKTAALDHITPISKGGTNQIDNLQWLDRKVNKAKSTMMQDDFIKLCRAVASHHPRTCSPNDLP